MFLGNRPPHVGQLCSLKGSNASTQPKVETQINNILHQFVPDFPAEFNVQAGQHLQPRLYWVPRDQCLENAHTWCSERFPDAQADRVKEIDFVIGCLFVWVMHQNPCEHLLFLPRDLHLKCWQKCRCIPPESRLDLVIKQSVELNQNLMPKRTMHHWKLEKPTD